MQWVHFCNGNSVKTGRESGRRTIASYSEYSEALNTVGYVYDRMSHRNRYRYERMCNQKLQAQCYALWLCALSVHSKNGKSIWMLAFDHTKYAHILMMHVYWPARAGQEKEYIYIYIRKTFKTKWNATIPNRSNIQSGHLLNFQQRVHKIWLWFSSEMEKNEAYWAINEN